MSERLVFVVTVTKRGRGGGGRSAVAVTVWLACFLWLTAKLRQVVHSAAHVLTSCFTQLMKHHYDVTVRNAF